MVETSSPEIVADLRQLAAKIIQTDPDTMEADQPLKEYGITSIELIDLIRRIENQYAITFQPDAFQEITISALAENVIQAMGGEKQ